MPVQIKAIHHGLALWCSSKNATAVVALLILFLTSSAHAADTTDKEKVFELDPFRVTTSRDQGYTTTNSVSGTLLDTPLKETPFAIDVMTMAFIEDTGSTNFREALAYDSGAMLDNTLEQSDGSNFTTGVENDDRAIKNKDTDIVVRGFRAPTLKNGFFTQTSVDTINIARMESASGPVSLLYGVGAISGITNIFTAVPFDEPRYSFEAYAGSNAFMRFTSNVTGPLAKEKGLLSYRVTSSWQTEDELYDFGREERFFFSPVIQWSPTAGTRFLVEMEYGTREQEGTGTRDITDNRLQYNTDTDERGSILEDTLGLGRFVNLSGPDATTTESIRTYRVELTQQLWKDFTLLAAASWEDFERSESAPTSLRHFRPSGRDGVPDAYLVDRYTISYAWTDLINDREGLQSRVSLLYRKEIFGGVQSFVLGRQSRSQKSKSDNPDTTPLVTSLIAPDGSTIRYAGEDIALPASQWLDEQWYEGSYFIYQGSFWNGRLLPILGYRWDNTQTRLRQYLYEEDGSLEWDETFLGDRHINPGGYDDEIKKEMPTAGLSVQVNDALTVYGNYSEGLALANVPQRDGGGQAFAPPFMKGREIGMKFSFLENRVSGRLTWFSMDKLGGVRYSFYVPNPSRGNFDPDQPVYYALSDSQADAFEDFMGSSLADAGIEQVFNEDTGSYEWRVYWEDFGDQLYAYNEQERQKRLAGEPHNGISYAGGNNPSMDRGAYHLFDEQSEGWEFRLNLNITDNWSAVLSYTRTEVLITSGITGLYDDPNGLNTGLHPVFFELGPENFSDPTKPVTYFGDIGANTLNNDTPKHAFTLWSKYAFDDGILEGLDIRGGMRYQSERIAESPWTGGIDAIERGQGVDNAKAPVPEVLLFDIGIGYTRDIRGIEWSIDVNVRNLFDEVLFESYAPNRTVTTVAGTVPVVTRYYTDPREVRFSLRARF